MNGNGAGRIEQLIGREGSVAKADYKSAYVGTTLHFTLYPSVLMSSHLPEDVATLSDRQRDTILSKTPAYESFWGSANAIAIAKVATRGYEIESDVPLQRKRAQELLNYAVAGINIGWKRFLPYHLQGYLNRSYTVVEIIRESRFPGSRPTGIAHLAPRQCYLTGNPTYPVEYVDAEGEVHRLGWWQVGVFSDMPDPNGDGGGAGICAAQRAYPHIRKLAALEEYVTSKITGDRAQAIYITNAMNENQLREGLNSASDDGERKGRKFSVESKGAKILPSPRNEDAFLLTIPLAELPDGFDVKQEVDRAILAYANALGIDVQDLQPLTGQALGTGAQSQVLDSKGKGKGLNLWADQFMEWLNHFVLSEKVMVTWYSRDLRDEKAEADIQKVRADTHKVLIEAGIETGEQAKNVLIDEGDLPEEYRDNDITQTGELADDEKVELVEGQPPAPVQPVAGGNQPATPQRRTAFTPSQTQGIVTIVGQAQRGDLTRATAMQLLKTAYSLTDEEASSLLSADDPKEEVADIATEQTKAIHTDLDALFDEELARARRVYKAVA
jgi:hypothetical protein